MSSSQLDLAEYGVVDTTESSTRTSSAASPSKSPNRPLLGFESQPDSPNISEGIAEARNANWVVYTGRYPHTFDAIRLGFGIGHREDSSYQWTPDEVDLPVHFLDNNYRNADLDRFVQHVFEYEPEIAVLGDIYDANDLNDHLLAAAEIWGTYPNIELILVPKCEEVLEEIPEKFILGYPNGNSDIQALDIATHEEWRSLPHQLHILGGTPLSTHEHIIELTRNHITDTPVADIAGLDWNGYQLYAENHGDYADATGGWHRNLRKEYIPKRDLIRYSLLNAKHFWASKDIWPNTGPNELQPREELLAANNGGPIDLTTSSDSRELLLSPPPKSERHKQPIYRTDETQTEIIEPLSPVATIFGKLAWSPNGILSKEASYSTPSAHHTEPTCFGCGRHILAEANECASKTDNRDHTVTLQLVSYEHQRRDTTNDFESVADEGPTGLDTDELYPAIHCFCSDTCRKRAEYQSPHLLLRKDHTETIEWPEGTTISKLEINTKQR